MESGQIGPNTYPGSESDPIAVEIEVVKAIVAKYFPIYDVKVGYQSLTMFISPDLSQMDDRFDQMRLEMNAKGYIPMLNLKGGEYTVTVLKREKRKRLGIWVNVILSGHHLGHYHRRGRPFLRGLCRLGQPMDLRQLPVGRFDLRFASDVDIGRA